METKEATKTRHNCMTQFLIGWDDSTVGWQFKTDDFKKSCLDG
jgi:hypothetical protein